MNCRGRDLRRLPAELRPSGATPRTALVTEAVDLGRGYHRIAKGNYSGQMNPIPSFVASSARTRVDTSV